MKLRDAGRKPKKYICVVFVLAMALVAMTGCRSLEGNDSNPQQYSQPMEQSENLVIDDTPVNTDMEDTRERIVEIYAQLEELHRTNIAGKNWPEIISLYAELELAYKELGEDYDQFYQDFPAPESDTITELENRLEEITIRIEELAAENYHGNRDEIRDLQEELKIIASLLGQQYSEYYRSPYASD